MTDAIRLTALVAGAFGIGAALGWLFYAGLYRTVRALPSARHPALLLSGSLALRMLLLLLGFFLLLVAGEHWTGDGWLGLVPALVGVIAVRVLLLRRYGRPGAEPDHRQRQPR